MGMRPLTALLATAALGAVTATAVTAASAATAQPATRAASPATALQVTGVGCVTERQILPGQTEGAMHCTAGVTGGITPYSYQWVVTSGPASVNPTGTKKFGITSGECTYGKYFVISVTVTDAANATATSSATDFCDPEGP
jgi:hypothetical protein